MKWLPGMAAGDLIGCFGMTEPTAGSDLEAMVTTAERDGDGWVLTGAKRWIGFASIADVAIIWARTDDGIRGFVVPTASEGFVATPIEPKLSMRASIQCDVILDRVRLPLDAVLPRASGIHAALFCLDEARYALMWGAMGAARDAYQTALRYASERYQFGQPLGSFQLTQQKLVDMVLELQKGVLVAVQTGRLKDAGKLRSEQMTLGSACRRGHRTMGRHPRAGHAAAPPRVMTATPLVVLSTSSSVLPSGQVPRSSRGLDRSATGPPRVRQNGVAWRPYLRTGGPPRSLTPTTIPG